ncbi:HipA N-terminal domain-containing protein [Flagellimonas halotolerans]|uniref:HipA N-terminal domain-containing protein n=1 Tax=Flagellimonas halotolerans TaxID=3112164 RepID=A0ABU6IRU9_9FLAO|nr:MULTISPECIES: HipA N-terminal domain-containing protein [unclassified Allomuricauda]MEC3965827.1 HipA N-terminal domain-containing protein [Muricauda sp. SYSU M86414]MEC4265707.1 HipA N-terminal domain-containing protein [Muricauda sp. SYSU M84420]
MRKAIIFYDQVKAGELIETNDGDYVFQYDSDYVKQYPDQFISFSMPVRKEPFRDNKLFPFFEGLIPEGWLLNIASKNWKLNKNDRMGLLLACCQNCIGAISVEPLRENHDE